MQQDNHINDQRVGNNLFLAERPPYRGIAPTAVPAGPTDGSRLRSALQVQPTSKPRSHNHPPSRRPQTADA